MIPDTSQAARRTDISALLVLNMEKQLQSGVAAAHSPGRQLLL